MSEMNNDKMGRNPFEAKAKPETKPEAKVEPKPKVKARSKTKGTEPSKARASGLRSLREWKLERLSFLRIEGDTGTKPRVTFLDLRLKNVHWNGPRSFEVHAPFVPTRWLVVRLISAKVLSV